MFDMEEKVILSTENVYLRKGRAKELAPKYCGPYEIIDRYSNGLPYRLYMPTHQKIYMLRFMFRY